MQKIRPIIPRLFLHYFDLHFLEAVGLEHIPPFVREEMEIATRIAVAASDEVVVPAASYIESTVCGDIVNQFRDLFELGVIWLAASEGNLRDFRSARLEIYRSDSQQASAYRSFDLSLQHPAVTLKASSTTQDIARDWRRVGKRPRILRRIIEGTGLRTC